MEGTSFATTFDDAEAKTDQQTQFYSMGGTRAIRQLGWKSRGSLGVGAGHRRGGL